MQQGIDYIGVGVTFLCHDGAGNILLHLRSAQCRDEHGRWDIGGGGIDHGETIEDTLTREIKEEFCTDIIAHELLGYRDVHREQDGARTHWIMFDFLVHIARDSVAIGEPHKCDDIGWYTFDTLPAPMHSQWIAFVAQYTSRLLTVYSGG
jgi:8-oxo-dGTP diphosphatase